MNTRQLCTFFLHDLFIGIDVREVQEVLRFREMTRVPRAARMVRGFINLRGQIVLAVDLRRRLELPDLPAERSPMNVVIRTEDGVLSLLVDELSDVLEVEETTYEPTPPSLSGIAQGLISGAYKLQDRLLLVLNTAAVLGAGAGCEAAETS